MNILTTISRYRLRITTLGALLALTLQAVSLCAQIGITDVRNTGTGGNCSGSALAYANGNSGPFTFRWSSGATTRQVNNLCAGVYAVTVTNRLGCNFIHQVTIDKCDGEASYNSVKILSSSVTHVREDIVNPSVWNSSLNFGSGIYLTTDLVNPPPPNPWPLPTPKKYFKWVNAAGTIISTDEDLVNVPSGKYCVYMKVGCGEYGVPTCFQIGSCNTPVPQKVEILVNSLPICIGPTWGSGGNLMAPKEFNGYPITSYAWSGPNGFTATGQSITPTAGPGGYSLTVTNTCGARSTASQYMNCCNDIQLGIGFENPCFKLNFILHSGGHDAFVYVGLPYMGFQSAKPECAKKVSVKFNNREYLTEFDDLQEKWVLKSPILPGHAGIDDRSTLVIKVDRNSLNGVYTVTAKTECGCQEATRSINFGNEGSPYGYTASTLKFLCNVAFTPYFSSLNHLDLGWTNETWVITGCGASTEVCGSTNGYVGIASFEKESYFTYVREEGKGPCEGGTLTCNELGTFSVPINGTPIVNWDKQIAPCTYATGCLFPAGNIPGITNDAPVFVIDNEGFRVPGTNCGNEPPSGSQCPDGVAIPLQTLESCVVRYVCRTTGETIEERDYSEYCICADESPFKVVKRCLPPGLLYPADTDPRACGLIPTDLPLPSPISTYQACFYPKPGPDTLTERSNTIQIENIELLPNPTFGVLQGVFTSPNDTLKDIPASISNMQGEIVSSMFFRLKSKDTFMIEAFGSLPAGIYFVRFELEKPLILKVVKSTD